MVAKVAEMSNSLNSVDDEVNLGELVAALWANKTLIILVLVISISLGMYLVQTTEEKFTAKAIFQIEEENKSGLNLSGDIGALASLAGFSGGAAMSGSEALLERVVGREFILDLNKQIALDRDPYFNNYNPKNKIPKNSDYKEPNMKALIKKFIGHKELAIEPDLIVENNIIKNYRNAAKFSETDSGAILISVTHNSPEKAADYANAFMEAIRVLVEKEGSTAQDRRLNYLSETLADALQDMEKAQENLKNYTLKNSAVAQENFLSDSLKLDEFRMEKREAAEFASLLSIIEKFIKSGNLDTNSYEALRSNHPLVDDIEFRRVLGMSETISAWIWPEVELIEAVSATLRDRIKRLDVEIKNIEENATIYATSAEDLARFKRDVKIAEATYTVLIEQVKSQSLAAGFQPETFKVFEYATPPLGPSSPKRNLILMLSSVLGIFIGCAISLINGIRRGVYYTGSALATDANADLVLKTKSIKRLSRKSLSQIISSISKRKIGELDKATLKLANKKIIYVMNSGGRVSSSNGAQLLAANSAQAGRNIVLCDTTGHSEKELEDEHEPTKNNSDLPTRRIGDNISVLKGADGASFFTSKNFNSTIKELTSRFDQVYLCSSHRNGFTGLMALSEFDASLVMILSLRRTKKFDMQNIKTEKSIDLLFYE